MPEATEAFKGLQYTCTYVTITQRVSQHCLDCLPEKNKRKYNLNYSGIFMFKTASKVLNKKAFWIKL